MNRIKDKVQSINSIFWIFAVYVILSFVFIPRFGTQYNIKNILSQLCVLLTIACGQHFAVLNGGVDFSVTSVVAFTSVIGASVMSATNGIFKDVFYAVPLAIIVMLLIGLIFGLVNGLSIITFKMPSFIVTMATQMLGSGIAVWYTKGQTIGGLPKSFTILGNGSIFIFPYSLILTIFVAFISNAILSHTVWGRQIYAVGTNPKASFISGISVKRTILKLYVISSICASVGGIIMISQMEAGAPGYASNLFIDIMASIIIGGTSPIGGFGKISGTVIGALFIIVINVSLNLLGVPWFVISIIKGLIILIASSITLFRKVRSKS